MDNPCTECLRLCGLHGITACATCHDHEGECSYGGCFEPGEVTFDYDGVERRTFCQLHATAPRYGWLRAGGTAC